MSKRELFKSSRAYCDILKYEFILNKPCQKMDELMEDAFERLKNQEMLELPTATYSDEQQWSRRQARQFDSDSDDNECDARQSDENDLPNIMLPSGGHGKRIVLMTSIAPFANTYLAVVQSLYHLLNSGMIESEFLRTCVKEITNKVETFECKYGEWNKIEKSPPKFDRIIISGSILNLTGESISTDTMRNCMKMLEKNSVIEITSTTGVRLVSLCRNYDSIEGVRGIVHKIESTVSL